MNAAPSQQRMVWAFWAAAALAALGGLMPIVFAGPSSRLVGVLIPFWLAAIAFGACALLHQQGRITTAVVYFIAGLAIVFGLLAMFSLPLRLSVLGTCPAPPAPCTTGLPRPLTDAENTGMGSAAALGILSVFIGFFGLYVLYRRTALPPTAPPERRIPPIPPRPSTEKAAPHSAVAAQAEAEAKTPVDEPPPELPPHEEGDLPELPSSTESGSGNT